jgi:hypothetical protein
MSDATSGVTARLQQRGGICISEGRRTIDDVYVLVADTRDFRPQPGANGVPAYGADHPDNSALGATYRVKTVTFSQPDATSLVWFAKVSYRRVAVSANGGGDGEDPEEPPEEPVEEETSVWTQAKITTFELQEELAQDANGSAIVNAAGDPFENPPTITRPLPEILLTKRVDSSPAADVYQLSGSVNSASVSCLGLTIPARCGRLLLEGEYDFGSGEWLLNIHIRINPDTWDFTLLQNGYRYDAGADGMVKFTETTDDGRVVECQTPQLLAEDGGDGRESGPVFSTYEVYRAESWASLGLPSNL